MSTFVLVHGAWHGAWCWELLGPELQERGHDVIAMDLPIEDATATFDDDARVVVEAASSADDDVVLVGHSLGAMVIPLVAAARPVSSLVFLCGVIPNFAGAPWDDAPPMEAPGAFEGLTAHDDGSNSWPSVAAATRAFYADCREEQATGAYERLRRQNSSSLWTSPYPLDEWPTAHRVAVVGTDDAAVSLAFSRHVSKARLGVEPLELPGGHSPFLARPTQLADVLVQHTR